MKHTLNFDAKIGSLGSQKIINIPKVLISQLEEKQLLGKRVKIKLIISE